MRFPVSSIIMVLFGGISFFFYIVFNHALHGSSGLMVVLWDAANKTMGVGQLADWNANITQFEQGFGIACVLCFGLAVFFFIIDALRQPGEGMQ